MGKAVVIRKEVVVHRGRVCQAKEKSVGSKKEQALAGLTGNEQH